MDFFNDIGIYKEKPAFITENAEIITYTKLLTETDKIKRHLKTRCLVFCFCENNKESIIGYLSFLREKVVPVLINSTLHQTLVDDLLHSYKPRYLWLPKHARIHYANYKSIFEYEEYLLMESCHDFSYSLHSDLALLMTTSGSTGSPKLVRQTYRNIISNAESIAEYLQIQEDDKPITSLPMNYTFGLSIINSHLLRGSTIILTNKTLMDKDFWEQLKQYNATTFGGVPYSYEILKKLRFSRMNLPSLRKLTQAGGKLSSELTDEFAKLCEEKDIQFIVMYGQTEATARMSYLPSQYLLEKLGSIGLPIPNGEFWLEDDNQNKILSSGTVGELIYKGPNVTMGYASDYFDLLKDDENNGILRTGDMAKFDDEGFYYIVGRKKRFLKIFGNRVNLDEVEQILKNKGYDCACTGIDDKMKIYVTNSELDNDLISFISNRTGLHRSGFQVVPIDNIPRNDAGKVLYSSLN